MPVLLLGASSFCARFGNGGLPRGGGGGSRGSLFRFAFLPSQRLASPSCLKAAFGVDGTNSCSYARSNTSIGRRLYIRRFVFVGNAAARERAVLAVDQGITLHTSRSERVGRSKDGSCAVASRSRSGVGAATIVPWGGGWIHLAGRELDTARVFVSMGLL